MSTILPRWFSRRDTAAIAAAQQRAGVACWVNEGGAGGDVTVDGA